MTIKRLILVLAALAAVTVLQADVLKLKNGLAVQGTLVSANSREITFLGVDGQQKAYQVSAVAGIDFAPLPPPPAPKPAAAPAAAVLTIPAGTQVTVRTIDAIDGQTAKAGARYRASIDDPVAVGSQTAIPRGANCIVEVVSIQSGDDMALRLREINVGGKAYATSTQYADVEATGTSKTKKAVRRGVGLGAVGAGIGALAGGGSGAAIGAAVGGGVGAISAAGAKGKQINVPSETRLIFSHGAASHELRRNCPFRPIHQRTHHDSKNPHPRLGLCSSRRRSTSDS